MLEFNALAQQCAPAVHPATMAAVIRVESTFNPFAIGVVGARLKRQPIREDEAVATAKALAAAGYNFSLGIGQINRYNLARFGLDYRQAFEPCANLNAASRILKDCFERARKTGLRDERALQAAFSCYYSGNFTTGLQPGANGQPSYVQQVLDGALALARAQRAPPMRAGPIVDIKVIAKASVRGVRVAREAPQTDPPVAATPGFTDGAVMVYR